MVSLVWFRTDLRIQDNPSLKAAIDLGNPIIFLYILENSSKNKWSMGGAQKWWLYHSLISLQNELAHTQNKLTLRSGDPLEVISHLARKHKVSDVFWNRSYDPFSINRDTLLKTNLIEIGLKVESFNGSLLNEPWHIKNTQGSYYKVFTQYWKRCLELGEPRPPINVSIKKPISVEKIETEPIESWKLLPQHPSWAKKFNTYWSPGEKGAQIKLNNFIEDSLSFYKLKRDIPELHATSQLSPHLHFGEISSYQIWYEVRKSQEVRMEGVSFIEPYLRQLGWREFCSYLLYYHPELPEKPLRKEFSHFEWNEERDLLEKWQQGKTGFPLVDAGMRQLWETGWMHNRVRMIVASFLTKDLLINWIEGEKWFWDTLIDADLANNACGWQWVAGSGIDAQPYFRIFNPVLQSQKFDPQGNYIRQWIPELSALEDKYIHAPWETPKQTLKDTNVELGHTYPNPIVDHSLQRTKALYHYKQLKRGVI